MHLFIYRHKIKQGVILVRLQEYRFLLHGTVHRKTKSGEPRVKIRHAFAEHNKLLRSFKAKVKSLLSSLVDMQASTHLLLALLEATTILARVLGALDKSTVIGGSFFKVIL